MDMQPYQYGNPAATVQAGTPPAPDYVFDDDAEQVQDDDGEFVYSE